MNFDNQSVIFACDEHQVELTELHYKEDGKTFYCPRCGKYKWPKLHGEAAYDKTLIEDDFR